MPGRKCNFPDMTCKVVDEGRLQLLDCIGQGSFGAVYRARDLTGQSPSLLAVKAVAKGPHMRFYWKEVMHHNRAQGHPNIIGMRRYFHDEHFIFIVLDYCPGGDMWRAIKDKKIFAGDDELVRSVFLQIIDALQWCHDRGVYHRDLKPSNILISPDCSKVWLSDFGLASEARGSVAFHTGTQQFRSPECNNMLGENRPYDAVRNDIWALGVILINMLTGVMPWTAATKADGWYMAYVGDRDFLRYTLPISNQTDHILQRIFSNYGDKCVDLEELKWLVENVDNFWMSEDEVSEGERHLKRVYNNYRQETPAYHVAKESLDTWSSDSDDSNSILDDSDDSDEHSIGLHSPSLLALEEGRPKDQSHEPAQYIHQPKQADARVVPAIGDVPIVHNTDDRLAKSTRPARASSPSTAETSDVVSTPIEASIDWAPAVGKHDKREKGGRTWSLRRSIKRLFTVNA